MVFMQLDNTLIDILIPLVAATIGLSGAFLGAAFVSRQAFNLERFKLLSDMHREITVFEMMKVRVDSQNVLDRYRDYNPRELYDSNKLINDLKDVWVLIGFYERLLPQCATKT